EHGRTHTARLKAAALLVGPADQFDRTPGCDAGMLHGLQHLKPGQYAVRAVELPAGRLAVQMTPGQNRSSAGVSALTTHVQVANGIHADRATQLPCPGYQQLPSASVLR